MKHSQLADWHWKLALVAMVFLGSASLTACYIGPVLIQASMARSTSRSTVPPLLGLLTDEATWNVLEKLTLSLSHLADCWPCLQFPSPCVLAMEHCTGRQTQDRSNDWHQIPSRQTPQDLPERQQARVTSYFWSWSACEAERNLLDSEGHCDLADSVDENLAEMSVFSDFFCSGHSSWLFGLSSALVLPHRSADSSLRRDEENSDVDDSYFDQRTTCDKGHIPTSSSLEEDLVS